MENGPKKRGRKPKGGKILEGSIDSVHVSMVVHNTILHLKCSTKDLAGPESVPQKVEPYTKNQDEFTEIQCNPEECSVQQKVKLLALNLHLNNVNKRSDCFWCTCPFDTTAVHIPKSKINDQYQVYGSFCCPECAAAYLLSEPRLDNSARVERYHLINYLYAKNSRNIIPAPSPYYLLDKYYGTLTAEEYRKFVKNNSLVTVVDKPICSSYPELMQSNPEYEQRMSTKVEETTYRLCRKKRS
jgi:hypothetical protein